MRLQSPNLLLFAACTVGFTIAYSPSQPPGARIIRKPASSLAQQAVAIPRDQPLATDEAEQLPATDQWVARLNYRCFGDDVSKLGKDIQSLAGPDDVKHLNKMLLWRDVAALVGVATMWTAPNPLTVAALSTWTYASWTMVAHHTCHGGYNRVDAGKYNSRGFALGSVQRRCLDWLDWMQPEAWNVEHNRLHHYRLNEVSDPDLVQRNLESIREAKVPMLTKYAVVGLFLPIWKWFYYAPNTFKELQVARWKQEGKTLPRNFDAHESVTIPSLLSPSSKSDALRQVVPPEEFFSKVLAPFFVARLFILPAPLLAVPGVGPLLFQHAVVNVVLAELMTNVHAFITIVTNHAGSDMYTFDDAVKPKTPSFYVRQIVGSVNYDNGDDLTDFSHGFLNYQIEHHVWPDLSMRQYQLAAPKLKAICAKHGVPYVQESAFTRLQKTVGIMVGKATMLPFPTRYEPATDKAGATGVTWKTTNGAIDEQKGDQ